VLAFAGLWEVWGEGDDRLYTCTVITEPAVGALTEIHDRMPLVLPRDRWADWLDPAREDVAELAAPTPPELVEGLELRPVSPAVNSVKHNGVELTARVESVAAPADQPALF
jgi:putative SOS response-associated peptidase YedK